MKKLSFFIVLLSVVLFVTVEVFPGNYSKSRSEIVADNLLNGMNSPNKGLRTSSALRIFEFIESGYFDKKDFSTAVVPLLKMLRESKSETEKISAALALYKIEDGRGIYRLRGVAKFDSNEKVREVSKNLYYNYHLNNGSGYFIDF